MKATAAIRNVYDPLFMRTVKKAADRYRGVFVGDREMPINKQAFLDVDEHGPAWHLGHMRSAARVVQEKMDTFLLGQECHSK